MENLAEETWDVVIAGTSLPEALLALSLSRSGLKILHVDKHDYYGGIDAGLSLNEAQSWVEKHANNTDRCSNASISPQASGRDKLAASRAYTLSLKPQIIYASSAFLPSLVTSRVHQQLDFLAVGSWWVCKDTGLQRIPSTREDVFADDSLSRRDKMGLMKFMRYMVQNGATTGDDSDIDEDISLQAALSHRFKIGEDLHSSLSALALVHQPSDTTKFGNAVTRIRRHMMSMGYFGAGFAAVYPKYAGNAEIAQVACRAGAVGGAVYLLSHGIATINAEETVDSSTIFSVRLTNDTTVKARWVVGSVEDLPPNVVAEAQKQNSSTTNVLRSITIVADPLKHLLPQTADNGPLPAVAIVLVDDVRPDSPSSTSPIYLQIHSEDTGECPAGQCVIYGSTEFSGHDREPEAARLRLESAVLTLLSHQPTTSDGTVRSTSDEDIKARVLWCMSYTTTGSSIDTIPNNPFLQDESGHILAFPPSIQDIAFNDQVLQSVRAVWTKIVGDDADAGEFMCFDERNPEGDN